MARWTHHSEVGRAVTDDGELGCLAPDSGGGAVSGGGHGDMFVYTVRLQTQWSRETRDRCAGWKTRWGQQSFPLSLRPWCVLDVRSDAPVSAGCLAGPYFAALLSCSRGKGKGKKYPCIYSCIRACHARRTSAM